MSCDSYTSIDVEYDEVLCELHALQLKHNPMYVIFGGDLNTDLSRDMSRHTKSLIQYCMLIGVNLPINEDSCETISRCIPTPQWFKATQEQLDHYLELLDAYLKSIIVPYHLVVCIDVHCTRHMSEKHNPIYVIFGGD